MTKKITKLMLNGEEYEIREYQAWRQPGANTVAYYKLEDNANDYSWNWNNASWVWTASYTTVWWEASASFNRDDNYIDTWVICWWQPLTIACMFYFYNSYGYQTIVWAPLSWSWAPDVWLCLLNDWPYWWCWTSSAWEWTSQSVSENDWHFWAIRIDWNWNTKVQIDNDEYTWTTNSFNINSNFYIWAWIWNRFKGNVKHLAIWNESITNEELALFKQTIMA